MPTSVRPPDILTIDVEEWFHGHNYLHVVPPERWDEQEMRVVANTDRCLDLLRRYDVRATFFVLGWTAVRQPALVARIAAAGHEIGCHSHAHPVVYDLDDDSFRRDLAAALAALRDAGVSRVAGYRAPSFSLTPPVHRFLHVLREAGFRYDCSIFPIRHPRYGQPGSPREPFLLDVGPVAGSGSPVPAAAAGGNPASAGPGTAADADPRADGLVVVPMTTWRVATLNVPFAGGGYLRLLPWPAYAFLRDRALAQGQPNIIYLHPWELDGYRPRVGQSRLGRWRSQGGQDSMPRKVERLLRLGRFATMGEYVEERRRSGELPVRTLPVVGT
ncbi:MAG: DUF3473 domain-containing protein [Candidatus Krumholzibacteriia bacterium]